MVRIQALRGSQTKGQLPTTIIAIGNYLAEQAATLERKTILRSRKESIRHWAIERLSRHGYSWAILVHNFAEPGQAPDKTMWGLLVEEHTPLWPWQHLHNL